jgi:hypothetical protein
MEPSPITATTRDGSWLCHFPQAMPSPAEMEVLLWPVVKAS